MAPSANRSASARRSRSSAAWRGTSWAAADVMRRSLCAAHACPLGRGRTAAIARVRPGGTALLEESVPRTVLTSLRSDVRILAPGALVSPDISWQPIDERSAVARLHHGGRTVSATLYFGEDGLLRDFVSEDRLRSSPDGRTFTRTRFSTPVSGYRAYGPYRLAQRGEARWDTRGPEGEFAYGEFELLDIRFE